MNRTPALLSRFGIACLALLPLLACLNPLAADEPASGDAYAAFVRESTSGAKDAASERLRRVDEARAAFMGGGQAPDGAAPGHEASRAVTEAALLAVYDANGDGRLDDAERSLLRRDRILTARPSSSALARWRRMEARISANGSVNAAEKAGVLEIIRGRMEDEERRTGEGRER